MPDPTPNSVPQLDRLRRSAKALGRACAAGNPQALARLRLHPPKASGTALRHADFLHVVAQEAGFASWPALKLAVDSTGWDRAERLQRLKIALTHGQVKVVERLLADTPDLAKGLFGLEVALYDLAAVQAHLARDPGAATRMAGPRSPILHLAFSRHIHAVPDRAADMIAVAELLVAHGADVNDAVKHGPGGDRLSALFGAIGPGRNMGLARWLLEQGADPNDGESLYHATELGHSDGVALLLAHGARPKGTNALLRALDFNNHAMVQMLLAAGAVPDDGAIPALHHAARRMCDAPMADILLGAGADPALCWKGRDAYAMARLHGNRAVAGVIEAACAPAPLSALDQSLAAAADGVAAAGPMAPPDEVALALIRDLVHLPGTEAHIARLAAMGLEVNLPDAQGVTPVQAAGWAGKPDLLRWFLGHAPDLNHVNAHGGTLLTTIIHGSENCPPQTMLNRIGQDHAACIRLALAAGVPLPRRALTMAGNDAVAEALADWAEAHPEQVTDG